MCVNILPKDKCKSILRVNIHAVQCIRLFVPAPFRYCAVKMIVAFFLYFVLNP